MKAREFVEIDTEFIAFNNPLLQLKIKNTDRLKDTKLMNNLLNCFRHQRNILRKNSKNSNVVSWKKYSKKSSLHSFCFKKLILKDST